MWRRSPDELVPLGLRPKTATPLRCTAEHLQARCEGGGSGRENIAAACWSCNVRRHRLKNPPTPEAYRDLVQRRMANRKWHCFGTGVLR
ncbi:MAG: HNH endonuclease [Pseudomonas sp.]